VLSMRCCTITCDGTNSVIKKRKVPRVANSCDPQVDHPLQVMGQVFTPQLVNQVRPRVCALCDCLLDWARGPDGPAWCCVS
jgi:hypothetical protein